MSRARRNLIQDDVDADLDDPNDSSDLLDYNEEAGDPNSEVIDIDDDTDDLIITAVRKKPKAPVFEKSIIRPPYRELGQALTQAGQLLKPDMTVELADRHQHERPQHQLHSGDFLRIKHIIENTDTHAILLRGYKLRRAKYHGQLLDWKLNELVMVLHVNNANPRQPFVQGMEDINITEVFATREAILTRRPYPLHSFQRGPSISIPTGFGEREVREQVFHHGKLACRWVNILLAYQNGKSYGGIFRRINPTEADGLTTSGSGTGLATASPRICIEADTNGGSVSTSTSTSKRPALPKKKTIYTFGDAFCGAGGASQGAVNAGLFVVWGLDHNHHAIQAFCYNHPGARPFLLNADEFRNLDENIYVDILHLSPPCPFWSPAHTRQGANDQENYETIFAVAPIIEKVKPRAVVLEQTYGLLVIKDHNKMFKMLLNSISRAGYNTRYKIEDLSHFGVPQRRKRLLIIAAQHGTPLPPFPSPTHGPERSGLKRLVSVASALEPLERQAEFVDDDPHHLKAPRKKAAPRPPYDPHTKLLSSCITTSGGENYHYNGDRKYTVREMSLLQTFPYGYHFSGSQGEAMKQVGNAFPPVAAQLVYQSVAQTLEAFDHGLIKASDDIDDLEEFLKTKGIDLPKESDIKKSPYRYLFRKATTLTGNLPMNPSLFGRSATIEPEETIVKKATSYFGVIDDDDLYDEPARPRAKRPKESWTFQDGEVVNLIDDDE